MVCVAQGARRAGTRNDELRAKLAERGRLVNAYFDLAESRARLQIPMTMEDWATRLDAFLEFNDRKILHDKGKVSKRAASQFARSDFEKYRVTQDLLYRSDFDQFGDAMKEVTADVAEGGSENS